MRAAKQGLHTSGAETICTDLEQANATAQAYLLRAINHEHGSPDDLNIRIAEIRDEVRIVDRLRVEAIECQNPAQAKRWMHTQLNDLPAAAQAIEMLYTLRRLRGAALVDAHSGQRLDPDQRRGVRASTFGSAAPSGTSDTGSTSSASDTGSAGKDYHHEALTLASKVAACPHIVAELCISDDPAYTTGYLARGGVYYRIPNAKALGHPSGGRVFLIDAATNPQQRVQDAITFLEHQAVLVR
ncbi:6-carboxyhexanoate--CoA ligase [Corynebacterium pseudopelargi]|uniref:6-carboxyhexanoate--CoA ligase n=2 Tax=Corynebacterium pseudopelargi TaxID=2080757 RepID=A0A3G6IYD6_9CORY|nr:6-carboxyhexanoate--CoA ligase [Corynebacterium pseudopelargi]